MYGFSWARSSAVMRKELIQLRRDRLTLAMLVMIPIIQLILFGYAINSNPKNLPVTVVLQDYSPFTRSFLQSMKNSAYFKVVRVAKNRIEAETDLKQNRSQFIVTIPEYFTRRVIRGERPSILVEADATDPVAVGRPLSALQGIIADSLSPLVKGPLDYLKPKSDAFKVIQHVRYNPEAITQYNTIPGLVGLILTMTLVLMTSMAITRERERGNIERLLVTPLSPLEVMIGKISPYIVIGYMQAFMIVIISSLLFETPIDSAYELGLLAVGLLPFMAANLSVGLMFSSLAENQLQAMQMTFFFFLPSVLISGFMFPFKGMPVWAQWIGEILPLTHFNRIIRGILLKGYNFVDLLPEFAPILIFLFVAILLGISRYRQTLD